MLAMHNYVYCTINSCRVLKIQQLVNFMDKRRRSELFRERLEHQISAKGMNRSSLARATGVDRSTIAQLLSPDEARLPNAHLAAECADVLDVSTDWLLGLTEQPARSADILEAAVKVPRAARSTADDQLLGWHREAAGYKIRHVPAALPDVLKTERLLAWEYERHLGKSPKQAIGAMRDRHEWMRQQMSDYEIAMPVDEFVSFAAGTGYYEGLGEDIRKEQAELLVETTDRFFPSLRIFLFDKKRVFSAPLTVFGPLVGAVYVGRFYMAFRTAKHIKLLTEHFDMLVREADVDARDVSRWLSEKSRNIEAPRVGE